MSGSFPEAVRWLTHTLAAGGGLLLLAAALMAVVHQPVRRRMIGAWAVRAALVVPLLALAPKWLRVPLPEDPSPVPVAEVRSVLPVEVSMPAPPGRVPTPTGRADVADSYVILVPTPAAPATDVAPPRPGEPARSTAMVTDAAPAVPSLSWIELLLGAYILASGFFLIRWLLGHVIIWRLLRRSRPASRSLTRIFDDLAAAGRIRPRLRVVAGLQTPVCCGLWRPVVLLPQPVAEASDEQSLRWVFAHELAHLERGDAWTAFWFGPAQALYFPLPWFWWLKRQVGLCQEYVADAAAAPSTRAEEYAAFLIHLSRSTRPARPLAAASGVVGSPSELFRRITMLLNNSKRVEPSCPRRWSVLTAGAFLSAAVILSGVGLARNTASPLDTPEDKKPAPKVDEPKKDEAKKDEPKADDPKKDGEEKFVRPRRVEGPRPPMLRPGLDAPQQLEAARRMMEEMQKRMQEGGFGGPMVFPRFGGIHAGSFRLGAMVEKPSATLVEQLDLPKDQGLVLTEIRPDSAAAKAGLKPNDILLEINGKAVATDPQEFRRQLADVKADAAVDAVVLRKGKRETVKGLKLPEAQNEPENAFGGPGVFPVPLPRLDVAPPFQALPGFPNGPGAKSISIEMTDGNFTIRSKENDEDISVTGELDAGKATIKTVKITSEHDKITASSLEKVPEKYREKVEALLKNIHVRREK